MLKETLLLWLFSWRFIPLIFYCRPRVLQCDDAVCWIKIPFKRRTKNHVNSMYFGALATGADLAAGYFAMSLIRRHNKNIGIIFKSFSAEFLKRAEGDVVFKCDEGEAILACIETVVKTKERQHIPIHIQATVPTQFGDTPIATFELTLSMKEV